jgi:X-X-X-Leu-X-X-Gly heptad repeat protein
MTLFNIIVSTRIYNSDSFLTYTQRNAVRNIIDKIPTLIPNITELINTLGIPTSTSISYYVLNISIILVKEKLCISRYSSVDIYILTDFFLMSILQYYKISIPSINLYLLSKMVVEYIELLKLIMLTLENTETETETENIIPYLTSSQVIDALNSKQSDRSIEDTDINISLTNTKNITNIDVLIDTVDELIVNVDTLTNNVGELADNTEQLADNTEKLAGNIEKICNRIYILFTRIFTLCRHSTIQT